MFVLRKVKMLIKTTKQRATNESCEVNLLKEDRVKYLYHTRVSQYLHVKVLNRNLNREFEESKEVILKAAEEALGKT
jgi:hypothetical protein